MQLSYLCVDQSTRPPPSVASLLAAGVVGINQYLSDRSVGFNVNDPKTWAPKCLRPNEVKAYTAAGIGVWANFETSADFMRGGYNRGVEAARNSLTMMAQCDYPNDCPVYFSLDIDPNYLPNTDWNLIDGFLDGAASVLGVARVGGYGGYKFIKREFDAGRIKWGWQCYAWSRFPDSTGIYYTAWDSRAQLRQFPDAYPNAPSSKYYMTIDGVECDIDRAMVSSFGQTTGAIIVPGGFLMGLTDSEQAEVLRAARQVNAAIGSGQLSFEATIESILATVQALVNEGRSQAGTILNSVNAAKDAVIGYLTAHPATADLPPDEQQAIAANIVAQFQEAGVKVDPEPFLDALHARLEA